MLNFSHIRKLCILLCMPLCACSLSGCSAAMQLLADGTDAVLSGLADGTDTVLDGLADGTDQALDSLSEGDYESAKDSILEAFDAFAGQAGAAALTPEARLQGRLEKGIDDYTGSYEADYSDFTGTEFLFGGTALEREAGDTIHIACSLSIESGKAAVFLRSGAGEPVILLSESGTYDGTAAVNGTSTYIGIWGKDAKGSLSIEVE